MASKFTTNEERQEHLLDLLDHGCVEDAQRKLFEWVKNGVLAKPDFDRALDNFWSFRR